MDLGAHNKKERPSKRTSLLLVDHIQQVGFHTGSLSSDSQTSWQANTYLDYRKADSCCVTKYGHG